MSEEEVVNRFLNMIATEYDGNLARQFKNQYILRYKEIEDLQQRIDKAIDYINKHCVNEKVSKEVGYKCYTMADTNELEHIMKLLGDKE